MKVIKFYIEWLKHFFWLIGWSFWCLIQFDINNCIDTLFWLMIHLTCKVSISEEKRIKISLKQKILNYFCILIGIVIFLIIINCLKTILYNLYTYGK